MVGATEFVPRELCDRHKRNFASQNVRTIEDENSEILNHIHIKSYL